ncbi:MAG: 30S ribosomal protein S2, partial [Deltaproteobacteria bacterium]|nr:30S ribosomal protein S2 [Deltaproteobacteria bacterium]
ERERLRLEKNLGGMRGQKGHPGAIFVVDSRKEQIAVKEGRKLGIPVVAIVDSNCDPDEVDYIIPGNDDAIRAIELFSNSLADACIAGRAIYEEGLQKDTDKETTAPVVESDFEVVKKETTEAPKAEAKEAPKQAAPKTEEAPKTVEKDA